MTQAAQALSTALLHFLWQGIIVGVSLGIALTILRKSSAATRYAVCCVALVVLALAPVITGFAVYTTANPVAAVVTPATPEPAVDATTISESARRSVVQDPQRWILPLWVAGVLVFALRFVWAGGYAYALRRNGVEADGSLQAVVAALCERLEIRRRVRVIVSSIAEVPSTLGWLRPVILLPSAVLLGITPQQLEALIAHELAHVRRCDYFVNVLQMVVETFLFYHPAVWWISSRVRYERELCCDDLAVRLSGDAVTYARALAQIEKLRPAEGIVMGSANGPVFHRIQRLLGIHSIEHGPSKFACALGLLVGMLCLGFFMNTARAEQDLPRPQANTEVDKALQNLETVIQELHGLTPFGPTAPVPPLPPVPPALSPEAALPALPAVPPPAAPLPPSPPEVLASAAAPVPQLAPAPPLPPVGRLLHTVSAESSHWVLFSGTDLILHGDATDETDARKARQSLNGDLLWFRLEGKAYVTQDKEILDRIRDSNASQLELARSVRGEQDKFLAENFEIQKKLAEVEKILSDLDRTTRSLELAAVAKKLAEVRNMPSNDNPNLLLDLQRRLEMLSIDAGKKESELELGMKNLLLLQRQLKGLEAQRMGREETQPSRDVDILREAVRSGKAQPAP